MTTLAEAQSVPSPARLGPHAFAYEACDIPPGMTIDAFRSQRLESRRRDARRSLGARVSKSLRCRWARSSHIGQETSDLRRGWFRW